MHLFYYVVFWVLQSKYNQYVSTTHHKFFKWISLFAYMNVYYMLFDFMPLKWKMTWNQYKRSLKQCQVFVQQKWKGNESCNYLINQILLLPQPLLNQVIHLSLLQGSGNGNHHLGGCKGNGCKVMVGNGISERKCILSQAMDIDACKYNSTILRVNQCASYATSTSTNIYTFGEAKASNGQKTSQYSYKSKGMQTDAMKVRTLGMK